MNMELEIGMEGDKLKAVLKTLKSVYGLRSDTAVAVLHLLCTKASPDGTVVVTPEDREKLLLTSQSFTNALKLLKDAVLISGSHNLYTIDPCVPYKFKDKLNFTIQFISNDPRQATGNI
jgi:hypothetical protein